MRKNNEPETGDHHPASGRNNYPYTRVYNPDHEKEKLPIYCTSIHNTTVIMRKNNYPDAGVQSLVVHER